MLVRSMENDRPHPRVMNFHEFSNKQPRDRRDPLQEEPSEVFVAALALGPRAGDAGEVPDLC